MSREQAGRPAERRRRPAFIPPMLATLVAAPFDDPDWLFEVKWDGFRVEAVVDGGEVRLWTRGEQDAERYFGPFLAPPTWIAATPNDRLDQLTLLKPAASILRASSSSTGKFATERGRYRYAVRCPLINRPMRGSTWWK